MFLYIDIKWAFQAKTQIKKLLFVYWYFLVFDTALLNKENTSNSKI